ncbi:ACT domain-containing protein [Pseudocolwellia sp. AS88]|jgi:glycine cleavage system transcriptional repressor|uniref:glycine cleavage system protein R n=1 Tax=Pseudocolwellia TaxID=2848177 RepID=UPI0026F13C5E|nr:ACT domain-containing protein [Pseudocolwellia sp. AS88]MDO7084600.1 ACT domain-containing protein [Pseudocolwellia sp. AS88]
MSQYLVLNAMGSDRTGSVSEIIKLASKCGCNIIDSRMAIFGEEFTLIMLLEGSAKSINLIESKFPIVSQKLELITMMKRTSGYKSLDFTHHYEVEYAGIDQPGILKSITAFLTARKIDISSLKSKINPKDNTTNATILIALTEDTSIDTIESDFIELCAQIGVQGCIKPANQNLLKYFSS